MANKKRLIDANALLERLANSSESWAKNIQAIRNWWPHAVGIKDNIVGVINDMPTVDAVEVVLCKDCAFWKRHSKVEKYYGACYRYRITKNESGYCDKGERRTDETKAD